MNSFWFVDGGALPISMRVAIDMAVPFRYIEYLIGRHLFLRLSYKKQHAAISERPREEK